MNNYSLKAQCSIIDKLPYIYLRAVYYLIDTCGNP
jgi:hypothetical protein